jgi:hypothetical protein
MKIYVAVLWAVTPYNDVTGYQRFRWNVLPPTSLHHEHGGSMDLWNVGILPQHYTVPQPSEDGGSIDLWNVGILP